MPGPSETTGPADPIGGGTALAEGLAPTLAMGMTYLAGAHSIGLAMGNAVANQQRGQMLANAALTRTLDMIIQSGAPSP